MKKISSILTVVVLLAASFLISSPASQGLAKGINILEFSTMVGVPLPYTGSTNPIRGINGGGLPWVISSAQGELKINGDIEVKVTGLVLDPNSTIVPVNLRGVNPVPQFKAVVSCLSVDSSGSPITVNRSTAAFPATTGSAASGGGDASIEDHVSLPTPCIAPIIFVTSPGGAWFAATGN